jgi:two-component system, OmpR family, sensor histidine kinase TctE
MTAPMVVSALPARSLFGRLLLLLAAILGAGAAMLAVAAWFYARTAANDAYDKLLIGAALQIAEGIDEQDAQLSVQVPTSAFEMLALAERDLIFYNVLDTSGQSLTGYADLLLPERAERAQAAPLVVDSHFHGQPVRVATVARFLAGPNKRGWAHVMVAQTLEARTALARDLTGRAVLLVGLMSALALAGAVLGIRVVLAPLKHIEHALRTRGPNSLDAMLVQTPLETQALVDAINHLIARLQDRIRLMHHFIADVAHQIRTPLTALTAQIELLGDAGDAAAQARHLQRVRDRAAQLGRLTNQLLSQAMVIHRAEAVPFEIVDLAEIARRALRDAVPNTVRDAVTVALEAPPAPVPVRGDGISLREAITNLIDNALRHGAHTRLTVRVAVTDQRAHVEVADDGPGIPAENRHAIRQRFSAGTGAGGGFGLGFAIATEVAQAHGGDLSFRDKRTEDDDFAVILTVNKV